MLNLNDEKSFDYGGGDDLFPFDVYGRFIFRVESYVESGPPGTETNKSDKEYDMASLEVLESNNAAMPVGSKTGFWFQTGGNGMTVKSRPFKIAELRAFVAALCELSNPKDRSIDWVAKRGEALTADYAGNVVKIGCTTTKGNPRSDKTAEDGTCPDGYYRNDSWFIVP